MGPVRKTLSIAFFILAVSIVGSCSSGERVLSPKFSSSTDSFSVTIRSEHSEMGFPAVPFSYTKRVDPISGEVSVFIYADDVVNLKGTALKVDYPSDSYRFVRSRYLGGLGREEEVVYLALEYEGAVYVGAVMIHYREKEGVNGDVMLFELTFAPGPARVASYSSGDNRQAPTHPSNAVTLDGEMDENNIVHLRWREFNVGDGSNDGVVNISDIFPLADHFFARITDPNSPESLADYDSSGKVDISDVFLLAETFFTKLQGYDVEYSTDGGQNWTKVPGTAAGQPTLKRIDLFPNAQNSDGRLLWTYDSEPIEGTYLYRVVPRAPNGDEGILSANTLEFTGVVEFEEVRISLPENHPGYLLITEEAIDQIPGNEQSFVIPSVQLKAEGRATGKTEFIDGTERVNWLITSSPNSATITNTSPGKGLLTAKDIGVVEVTAFDPDNILASATIEVPIYAISALELKVEGQAEPQDISVAKGEVVNFVATGIFDDNDSDITDFKEIDLTALVGWIIQRPVVDYDVNGNPIYEAGSFYVNTLTGEVYTEASDPDIQSGFRAFVSVVFPPLEAKATIGDGHRPVSNIVTITIE